jgi:hypothetical protein
VEVDTSRWSGEGEFTQVLLDRLREVAGIALLRVEDSAATRSDVDYNFISNELFVVFETRRRLVTEKRFGLVPVVRPVFEKVLTLPDLEQVLSADRRIGPPDYADETMLQYLRTERIVPPYQTKGYKLVELVRIYEVAPPGGR